MARLGCDDAVFADLRGWLEIERDGAIPGAFRVPRGNLDFGSIRPAPITRQPSPWVSASYSNRSAGWRSGLSAQTVGLKPVSHIAGGFSAWREATGPLESTAVRKARETETP